MMLDSTLPVKDNWAKLTLQQLESHLWSAANILSGKIDSSDYNGQTCLGAGASDKEKVATEKPVFGLLHLAN